MHTICVDVGLWGAIIGSIAVIAGLGIEDVAEAVGVGAQRAGLWLIVSSVVAFIAGAR